MMALRKNVILRSPQRGRLEGRAVPIQRKQALDKTALRL